MKQFLTKKDSRFLSVTLACCGLLMIGSGLTMDKATKQTITKRIYTLDITEQKIASSITNELKLKDIELEINTPLSLNAKDYVENIDEIQQSEIKA